jgi:hypothetical protein
MLNPTGSQILVGASDNTFEYTLSGGANVDNYNIQTVFGTLAVTDGTNPDDEMEVDDALVVSIIDQNEKYGNGTVTYYDLNDSVTYNIDVTNIYDEGKTITLQTIEGVLIDQNTFYNVPKGENISTTARSGISEADILAGEFTAQVTANVGELTK